MRDAEQAYRRRLILDVVETQLRDKTPPETKATLERLLEEGITLDRAMELIGSLVASEIFDIMKHHRNFDLERYILLLKRLPELPADQ